jgi:uracil permease
MIKKVDLEDNANLFTVSAILIPGIGGMAMSIGKVTITSIACALILGIIVNIVLNKGRKNSDEK